MANPFGWKKGQNPVGDLRANQLTADEQYAIDMYARAAAYGAKNSPVYGGIAGKTSGGLNAIRVLGTKPNDKGAVTEEYTAKPGTRVYKEMAKDGTLGLYGWDKNGKQFTLYRGEPSAKTVMHERTHAYQHQQGNKVDARAWLNNPLTNNSITGDFYYWYINPYENDARLTERNATQTAKNANWLNNTLGTNLSLGDLIELLR